MESIFNHEVFKLKKGIKLEDKKLTYISESDIATETLVTRSECLFDFEAYPAS